MPKISVLLPVFNAEKSIQEAIQSVLDQTFTDFELLILNDGSTDKSLAIIESFKDSRIKVFTNESNLKLIATLNKGLGLASGEYLARMDADDICLPERFEKQVKFLDENQDYVAVGSNYLAFGDLNFVSKLALTNEAIRLASYFENPMAHPTTMLRLNVLRSHSISYRPDLLHIEDWGLWRDLMKFGNLENLNAPLLHYRLSPTSVSMIHRQTFELRYKAFYKIILQDLFSEVSDLTLDLHYQLASGNYKSGSYKALNKYRYELSQKLKLMIGDSALVKKYLKGKSQNLVYQILKDSSSDGIKFALSSHILDIRLIRYIFGLKRLRHKQSSLKDV